jgi:hypothetical protein
MAQGSNAMTVRGRADTCSSMILCTAYSSALRLPTAEPLARCRERSCSSAGSSRAGARACRALKRGAATSAAGAVLQPGGGLVRTAMSAAARSADFVAPLGCDGALELAAAASSAAVPAAAAASASRFDAGHSARPASAAERFSTGACVDWVAAAASNGEAGAGAVSIGWQLGSPQVQTRRACLQTQTGHFPLPANLMDDRHSATGIGIL